VTGEVRLRRSIKLRSPSAASCLAKMADSSDARHSRAASGPRPRPARALANVAWTPSGACRAISCASSVARLTCAPAGTTSWTRPIRMASAAPNSSAVSRKRIALPQPSCAGARKVAPPNGTIPRPISSCRKRTSSAAITMSAASASSIDKVNAIPLTATTTGLGTRSPHTPNGSKRCEPDSTCGPCSATAGSDPFAAAGRF
jgi:hypothetical protein